MNPAEREELRIRTLLVLTQVETIQSCTSVMLAAIETAYAVDPEIAPELAALSANLRATSESGMNLLTFLKARAEVKGGVPPAE